MRSLEARETGEIPGTLRFMRFTPSVLLGAAQYDDVLIGVARCAAAGLAVQHRLTDGGTIFCDAPHLAWSLYLSRADVERNDARTVVKRLTHAAATALRAFGVDAYYRPRNEIAIDGRAIAVAGLAHSEDALLYQGVLALDLDPARRCSLVPYPWPTSGGEAILRAREAGLAQLLGRAPDIERIKRNLVEAYESEFGVELKDADLTLSEQVRYERALQEAGAQPGGVKGPSVPTRVASAAFDRGSSAARVYVLVDANRVVRQVWFTGLTLRPHHLLADFEAALRGVPMERIEARARAFFASRPGDGAALQPADFAAAIHRAVNESLLAQ